MSEIVSMIKNLIVTSVYLLFLSAFGHEIYTKIKHMAADAHAHGMVNMSDYNRALTSKK